MNVQASYPLSPMQKAMLLSYLMAPESGIYILQYVCTFRENLNVAAFKKAWEDIAARHDVLRTGFRWEYTEEPVQDVFSSVDIPFEVHDWQYLTSEEQKTRLDDFLNTDRKKKFNLSEAPVMRLNLFRLAAEEYKLIWTYHHAILDGACHRFLLEELFQFYEANCEGRGLTLPPAEPYKGYIDWIQQVDNGKSEGYWRQELAGFQAPNPVSAIQSKEYFVEDVRDFKEMEIRVSEQATGALQELARDNDISLNNITQGVWALFLSRYTGENDIVFGTVRAGRHWGEGNKDKAMGLFIYTLPMRVPVSPDKLLMPWLLEIKQKQYSVREHETTPLADIQKWSEVPPDKPLFESVVVFQNFYLTTAMQSLGGKWVNREVYWAVDNGYPVTLYANVDSRLILRMAYDGNRFADEEIRWLLENLKLLLENVAAEPDRSLGQFTIKEKPARQDTTINTPAPEQPESAGLPPSGGLQDATARAAIRRNSLMRRRQIKRGLVSPAKVPAQNQTADFAEEEPRPAAAIVISSTFTAEPVAESLDFWGRKLGCPFRVEFAPYNQVFQQLLDTSTVFLKDSGGMNVILLRFEDWIRDDKTSAPDEKPAKIEENVTDFIIALKSAASRSAASYLVCVCPVSPAVTDTGREEFFRRMEDLVSSEMANTGNVHVVKSAEITGTYRVADYYDALSDELGNVPYTPEFFAALGTMIARKFQAIYSAPYKVIVLDCDQTLWKGICGEDGPRGIEIDAPHRMLQEFMVAQYRAGMLLCLCSKNNEEDVDEVFTCHPEMPLKKEHIAASIINWRPKSENLKTLAASLGLGLDSFIFVDDNPVECNEVQTICPEVLTLCLPAQADDIPEFLPHVWAFDHLKITGEDSSRTVLYRQNAQRKVLQEKSPTLSDFIAGLGLQVRISGATPHHLARVAQLTMRTNQFNLTAIRRSEAEIQELCRSGALECLTAEVSDRFGDYGLVGVILFAGDAGAVKVDTFLLSCRALGRGVEHKMLARLGEIARERGLDHVEMPYVPTGKNRPGLDFLEELSPEYRQTLPNGFLWRLPARYAGAVTYNPGAERPEGSGDDAGQPSSPVETEKRAAYMAIRPGLFTDIAGNLNSAGKILRAVEARLHKQRPVLAGQYLAPGNSIERVLTGIWQKVISIDRVGVHDNFFEIGGTSLKAIQLIAQIKREFSVNISIVTIFEKPTISSLAATLAGRLGHGGAHHGAVGSRRDDEE